MHHGIFEQSFSAVWHSLLQKIVNEVQHIDRALFVSDSLEEHLKGIEDKYYIDIAHLDANNITGQRKEVERTGSDPWGDVSTTRTTVFEISIPILGDPQTIRFSPSRCTIPNQRSEIRGSSLCLTVADDANTDRNVQEFTRIVSDNLNALRAEYDQVRPQLGQTIKTAALSRKSQIEAEIARDKTRSFKIID